MKKAVRSFHQQVMDVVRKYWPRLVANEMLKLSGDKPVKAPKIVEPVIEEPKIEEPPPPPAPPSPPPIDLKDPMTYIAAFAKHGTKTGAAKALGIAETTFRERYSKAMIDYQKTQAAAS